LTHTPLWADPSFDDSRWEDVDLTPPPGSFDPTIGFAGYVPGWTRRGHPGYSGYAWYRIRVKVSEAPGEELALAGPSDVDDAYQAFANGALLGSFGDLSLATPVIYYTQPMMFPVPRSTQHSVTMVLAFRVWMERYTVTFAPDAGGFHNAPLIGDVSAIAAQYQLHWLQLIRAYAPRPLEALLFFLLAIVAFSLILFDRSDHVYLWMAAVFLLSGMLDLLTVLGAWTRTIGIVPNTFLSDVLFTPLVMAGWIMVWWVWFRLDRPTWMPRVIAGLTLVNMIANFFGEELFLSSIPQSVDTAFHGISLVTRLVFLALLVWIVALGIRLRSFDGWLVLPTVILVGIARFQTELQVLHFRTNWFPFGIQVTLADASNLLLTAVLAILLLRRLLHSVRDQRRLALDVKQAQEVQQVILPQPRTEFPGLVVESEYRPALEVGGDFFQIVPNSADSSLLIIAGDVTGKGLKAGMLVALLVGAIRTAVETTADPRQILAALNRRLLGRGEAHATCLALRIAADGSVSLANAGHMPPYLNGQPVSIDGALPLGMTPNADFSVMRFTLAPGDRLVVISDGIVEATDQQRQLFGFDRTHQLLGNAASATEIAAAAQSWGQEDDISVISVTRTAVLAPVTA
ncbi:MAG: PP2C family protein-serine/threonine phosphatase, partial [Acidobacteriaceae bacterium]